ncbi:AaceriAFR714Wp [[Ashbya] aceris (nom. inval.)]|nr:AaceriAFR714Wp [[Ashbya] aceris (nom. inval.)]
MSYETIPTSDENFDRDVSATNRNVFGWYLYAFSSEPFIVSAMSTYFPLLLEEFARNSGVRVEDHGVPCGAEDKHCVLPLFGRKVFVDTSSFALYTFALGVLLQTVLVISVSGVVDVCKTVRFKRNVLLAFGMAGGLATCSIALLRGNQYYVLALLTVVSNCCYGVINVVGNSLLPDVVSDLKRVLYLYRVIDSDQLTTVISGRGSGIGYIAAFVVQVCSVWLLRQPEYRDDIKVAVLLVGGWWMFFQLPLMWMLDDVVVRENSAPFKWSRSRQYLRSGWQSLGQAAMHANLLKDVLIFLVGWFIISDSITTINSAAILFSKTELHMSTVNLVVISILTMINAVIGAYFVPQFLSERLELPPHQSLIYLICWAGVIPFYGTLGFVFQSIGLKHPFEMYILAVWYGISMGGLAAVSRSVFSLLIPRGRESTFFSLFSITDKGSSVVGPLLIGLITDKTHNIRYSFYFLFLFVVASIPVFNALNVQRGKVEAEELAGIHESRLETNEGFA